jgi:hypothetical protein
MTKHIEIATLDKFIAVLGDHSYLGPWLRDNRAAIVADIGNDHPVNILLPGAAQREAERIVREAREEAERTRALASEQANQTRANAQKFCDDQRRAVGDLIAKHAAEAVARLYGRF